MLIYVCLFLFLYSGAYRSQTKTSDVTIKVTEGYELLDLGAKSRTHVLWKNNQCSQLPDHLLGPNLLDIF